MGDKVLERHGILLPCNGLASGFVFKSHRLVELFNSEFPGELGVSRGYEDAAKYCKERSSRVLDILQQSLGAECCMLSQVEIFGHPFSLLDFGYTWDTAVLRPLLIADIEFILSEEYNSDSLLLAHRLLEWMTTAVGHTLASWSDYFLTRFYTGLIMNVAVRDAAHVAAELAKMLGEQETRQAMLRHLRQVETTSLDWMQNHEVLLGEKLSNIVSRSPPSYGNLREFMSDLFQQNDLKSEESWETVAGRLFGRQADRYFGQVAGTSILCDLSGTLLPATFEKLTRGWQWDVAEPWLNHACSAGVYNAVEVQLRELRSASLACIQPMTREGVHPLHRHIMQQFVDLAEGACKTVQAVQEMLQGVLYSSEQFSWTGNSCFDTSEEFARFLNSLLPVMRCIRQESIRMDHAFFPQKMVAECSTSTAPSARLADFRKSLMLQSGAAKCASAKVPATPTMRRGAPNTVVTACSSNFGRQPGHGALPCSSRSLLLSSNTPTVRRRTASVMSCQHSRDSGQQANAACSPSSLPLTANEKLIFASCCQSSKTGPASVSLDALPSSPSLPVGKFSNAHGCQSAKTCAPSVCSDVPAVMHSIPPIELTSAQLSHVQTVKMSHKDIRHTQNSSEVPGAASAGNEVENELLALQQQSSTQQRQGSCGDAAPWEDSQRWGWPFDSDGSSISNCGGALAKSAKAVPSARNGLQRIASSQRGTPLPLAPEEVPLVKVKTDKSVMPELVKEVGTLDASPKSRLRLWLRKRCNGAKPRSCSRSTSMNWRLNHLDAKEAGRVAATNLTEE